MDKEQNSTVCEICSATNDLLVFQQFFGSVKNVVCICRDCAAVLGINRDHPYIAPRVSDLFTAVLDPDGVDQKDDMTCTACGCSYQEIRHSGLAGCSACYDAFKEEMSILLRRVSSRSGYRGKLPRRLRKMRNLLIEKPILRQKFDQALQREDYEDALHIRAQIENIDRELL